MSACFGCGSSLIDSQEVELDGVTYKSCPNCSSNAGKHVYYKYEDFGMRNMGDGRYIIQSWCPSCRSDENPSLEVEFTC